MDFHYIWHIFNFTDPSGRTLYFHHKMPNINILSTAWVPKLIPGGPVSLQSLAPTLINTPEAAYQGLAWYTRSFHAGVLRQVGAKLCRTPALQDRVWWPLVYRIYYFWCNRQKRQNKPLKAAFIWLKRYSKTVIMWNIISIQNNFFLSECI